MEGEPAAVSRKHDRRDGAAAGERRRAGYGTGSAGFRRSCDPQFCLVRYKGQSGL